MPKKEPHSEKGDASGTSALFAAFIIIAIVAALIIITLSGASGYSPKFPYFQNTKGPIPPQFANVLSESGRQSTYQISMLAKNHISKLTEFNVSYKGSIYIQPNGFAGTVTQINSPLYLNESKYHNDIKTVINATGIPILGSGDVVFVNLTNGTYVCTNFNATAISNANYGKVIFGSRNNSCIKSDSLVGVNFKSIAYFNFSALQNDGLNLNYSQLYQSTYNGNNCTFISGTIPPPQLNSTNIGIGRFQMCVSDTYYIPLSLTIYYNGAQVVVYINLNETSIGNYSKQSYVDSLP